MKSEAKAAFITLGLVLLIGGMVAFPDAVPLGLMILLAGGIIVALFVLYCTILLWIEEDKK